MARRKTRYPDQIPVTFEAMDAEYANRQYEAYQREMEASNCDKNSKKQSARYRLFYDSLLRLLYSNFKWYGIDPEIANTMEHIYIWDNRICAIKTKMDIDKFIPEDVFYGRYSSHPTKTSVDFYGRPIAACITGSNGTSIYANSPLDFVIGFDSCAYYKSNTLIRPLGTWLSMLANELDDAFLAWKTAAETRKCGLVFTCPETRSAQFLKNILSRIANNDAFIVAEGGIDFEVAVNFSPNNTAALTDFHMYFMDVWGLVLDLLGLENSSQNKKERLIVTEAEMNRSLSRYIGGDRLKARKDFAEECNKKFGTNIRVENYLASLVVEDMEAANAEGITKEDNTNANTDI